MNGLLWGSLALCLVGATATAGPHVFWASDPVDPNDTVITQALEDKVRLVVDGQLAVEYRDSRPATRADVPGITCWPEGGFDGLCTFVGTPKS